MRTIKQDARQAFKASFSTELIISFDIESFENPCNWELSRATLLPLGGGGQFFDILKWLVVDG
jgi:hypothetical protein